MASKDDVLVLLAARGTSANLAMDMAKSLSEACCVLSATGQECYRPRGHRGDHANMVNKGWGKPTGTLFCKWPQSKADTSKQDTHMSPSTERGCCHRWAGWICTRYKGHAGEHMAGTFNGLSVDAETVHARCR